MEMGETTYYRRYVVDIIIILHQYEINKDLIISYMNNIHKHFELKSTTEDNKNINYLDQSIHRDNSSHRTGKAARLGHYLYHSHE
jgi:hypothetical protein